MGGWGAGVGVSVEYPVSSIQEQNLTGWEIMPIDRFLLMNSFYINIFIEEKKRRKENF